LLHTHYRGSPSLLLATIFPEYQLLPWKFTVAPKNLWSKIENQKKFMNWAAEQLNIKEPSDWYTKTAKVRKFLEKLSYSKDFERIGGGQLLLNTYKGSPYLLLSTVFPEYQLLPWKFTACPHNFWSSVENQRTFMNWAAGELNITQSSDWYTVTVKV
jgi:hypothetical protein